MTKLVIVDDHEALREGLESMLLRTAVTRWSARPATSPPRWTSSSIAEPDVAIVDIRLPDGSGIDAHARAARPPARAAG